MNPIVVMTGQIETVMRIAVFVRERGVNHWDRQELTKFKK
jgi:hypothetical protein